jgi:aminoglycoside phosphotransferase (APT) family kinase protein
MRSRVIQRARRPSSRAGRTAPICSHRSSPTPEELTKLGEGREAEVFAWGETDVLRVMRDSAALESAKLEAIALTAAAAAGCAVPRFGELTSYEGRPALIMQRINGPDLLSLLGRRPWLVFKAAKLLGKLHADLHQVRGPRELPSLKDVLRRRIEVAPDLPRRLREFALTELEGLPDGEALCHGDFHPGNILDGVDGPNVIDWVNAARGDPDGDIAWTRLLLRVAQPPPGSSRLLVALTAVGRGLMSKGYLRSYRRTAGRSVSTTKWEPVQAASRMSTGFVEEFPALIELMERAKASASTP